MASPAIIPYMATPSMPPEVFVAWLNGLFELSAGSASDPTKVGLTPVQCQMVADHIALVLTKVTPERAKPQRAPRPVVLPDDLVGQTYCAPPSSGRLCATAPETPTPEAVQLVANTTSWTVGDEVATLTNVDGTQSLMPAKAFWAARLAVNNAGKVFITVSRRPSYEASGTYSYYPLHLDDEAAKAQLALLKTLGVVGSTDDPEVFCVVDNALNPRETRYNRLTGSSEHLTMVGDWIGILNVGVGEPSIC